MAQDKNRLIWVDMEMTGLDPARDRIIELALVITDNLLETVAEAPVWVVHQPEQVLEGMDAWNKGTHGRSGLLDKVRASTKNELIVQEEARAFLAEWIPAGESPMCGNSICQDRRFMVNYMPELERYFHYRNLDVSTLKELSRRWKPQVYSAFKKSGKHEALADIHESIEELRHYRAHVLKLD